MFLPFDVLASKKLNFIAKTLDRVLALSNSEVQFRDNFVLAIATSLYHSHSKKPIGGSLIC